ncbi:MAG: hypothetical protein ABIL62_06660 [Planctomycetota bacterium]
MKTHSYVGFLDILGFKDVVSNADHENLLKIYAGLSLYSRMSVSGASPKVIDEHTIRLGDLESAEVNTLVISDSIICWTKDDSRKSFYHIIKTARDLLWAGIQIGLPMRGALSTGTISVMHETYKSSMDNSQHTFLGKPIVDAFLKGKKQEWSGCVIDEKCIEKYNSCKDDGKASNLDDLVENKLLIRYRVPYKRGSIREEYAVNWPMGGYEPPSEDFVRKSFSLHKKNSDDWSVERKIQNTIRFLHHALIH